MCNLWFISMLFYATLSLTIKCPLCLCHLHIRMFVSLSISITVSLSIIFCMISMTDREQSPNQKENPVGLKVLSRQQRGDKMWRMNKDTIEFSKKSLCPALATVTSSPIKQVVLAALWIGTSAQTSLPRGLLTDCLRAQTNNCSRKGKQPGRGCSSLLA